MSENWPELESLRAGALAPEWTTYIWGQRYIDDLVLREVGEEKLYSIADPNWNVVAICDENGSVAERYNYDAFGKRSVFDAAFSARPTSEYNWNRAFTGQVLDSETGLMLYCNRYYSPELGRFVQRDPIGYEAEDENLYRYVLNNPQIYVDPFGEDILDDLINYLEAQKGCHDITHTYSNLEFSRVSVSGGNFNQRYTLKRNLTAEHRLKIITAYTPPKSDSSGCPTGYECQSKVQESGSNVKEVIILDDDMLWGDGRTILHVTVYYKGKHSWNGWKGSCKKCPSKS
ncbi:MAG: RHS repeat domain-containing protein [Thermoguttaceae bacterium]